MPNRGRLVVPMPSRKLKLETAQQLENASLSSTVATSLVSQGKDSATYRDMKNGRTTALFTTPNKLLSSASLQAAVADLDCLECLKAILINKADRLVARPHHS